MIKCVSCIIQPAVVSDLQLFETCAVTFCSYALLGNSLSIAVVAPLIKYLFTEPEQSRWLTMKCHTSNLYHLHHPPSVWEMETDNDLQMKECKNVLDYHDRAICACGAYFLCILDWLKHVKFSFLWVIKTTCFVLLPMTLWSFLTVNHVIQFCKR